jgi:hypothetical protein
MHHSRRTRHKFRTRVARDRKIFLLSVTFALATAGISPISQAPAAEINYAQAQQAPPDASQPPNPPPPTPPAAQTPPPKAPAATPAETPAMVLNGQQVESILGKKVRGAAGDDMGRIIDIIADKTGQVRAAIVDFGGFLGVGNRQIAVDWKAIRFPIDGKTDAVIVDLTKDQLRVAPVYKPGEQIVVLGQQSASPVQAPSAPQAATEASPVVRDPPSK